MILISFLRKKTSKIYFIILFLVFLIFGILIIGKNYYLMRANDNYKGSFVIVDNFDKYNLQKNKNIKWVKEAIVLDNFIFIKTENYNLEDYEIIIPKVYKNEYPKNSLLHYESYEFKIKDFYSESFDKPVLLVNNTTFNNIFEGKLNKIIDFKNWAYYDKTLKDLKIDSNDYIIYLKKNSSIDYKTIIVIFSIFIYVSFGLFIIIDLITILNLLNDEKKNNFLYKTIGYSKKDVVVINILKISLLLLMALIFSSLICLIIRCFLL